MLVLAQFNPLVSNSHPTWAGLISFPESYPGRERKGAIDFLTTQASPLNIARHAILATGHRAPGPGLVFGVAYEWELASGRILPSPAPRPQDLTCGGKLLPKPHKQT